MQNQYNPSTSDQYTHGMKYYGPGPNGTVCSWWLTPLGVQTGYVCELPYVPRPDTYHPPIMPVLPPTTEHPPTFPPDGPPSTTVPEPGSLLMVALGLVAVVACVRGGRGTWN